MNFKRESKRDRSCEPPIGLFSQSAIHLDGYRVPSGLEKGKTRLKKGNFGEFLFFAPFTSTKGSARARKARPQVLTTQPPQVVCGCLFDWAGPVITTSIETNTKAGFRASHNGVSGLTDRLLAALAVWHAYS